MDAPGEGRARLMEGARHGLVGREHELLDEAVAPQAGTLADADGLARRVELYLVFGRVQIQRAARQAHPVQGLRELAHAHDDLVHGRAHPLDGLAVEDVLHLFIGEAAGGADDGLLELDRADGAVLGDGQPRAQGQARHVGAQRAQVVGELGRQHRDDGAGQVDARAAAHGLLVQGRLRAHVMPDVGDVHAQAQVAPAQILQRHGVVEVLRVGTVDGEHGQVEELGSARPGLGLGLQRQGLGLGQGRGRELGRDVLGRQHRRAAGLEVVGAAEQSGHRAARDALHGGPAVDAQGGQPAFHRLHALGKSQHVHGRVLVAALGHQSPELAGLAQQPDLDVAAAFDYGENLAHAAPAAVLEHAGAHAVAVARQAQGGALHEHVVAPGLGEDEAEVAFMRDLAFDQALAAHQGEPGAGMAPSGRNSEGEAPSGGSKPWAQMRSK